MGLRRFISLGPLRIACFSLGGCSSSRAACGISRGDGSLQKLRGSPHSPTISLSSAKIEGQLRCPCCQAGAGVGAAAGGTRAPAANAAQACHPPTGAAAVAAFHRGVNRLMIAAALPAKLALAPRAARASSCAAHVGQKAAAGSARANSLEDKNHVLEMTGESRFTEAVESLTSEKALAERKSAPQGESRISIPAKVIAEAAQPPHLGGVSVEATQRNNTSSAATCCCLRYGPWRYAQYRLADNSAASHTSSGVAGRGSLVATSNRKCYPVACSIVHRLKPLVCEQKADGDDSLESLAAAAAPEAPLSGELLCMPYTWRSALWDPRMLHQQEVQQQSPLQQKQPHQQQHGMSSHCQQRRRRKWRQGNAKRIAAAGNPSVPAALPCTKHTYRGDDNSSRFSLRAPAPVGQFLRHQFGLPLLLQPQYGSVPAISLPLPNPHLQWRLTAAQFHTYGASQFSLHSPFSPPRHATTILCVRKGNQVCVAGDGMVSQGQLIVKPNARKLRRLQEGVVCGFAGATADCFTLVEKLESKLDEYPGQLLRACVELAKQWRTDRYLRHLEAVLIVADKKMSLEVSGVGDVLESHDGILGVGSGGPFAVAAARALFDVDKLSAHDICKRSMAIAASMCCHTNDHVVFELLENEAPTRLPEAASSLLGDSRRTAKNGSSAKDREST